MGTMRRDRCEGGRCCGLRAAQARGGMDSPSHRTGAERAVGEWRGWRCGTQAEGWASARPLPQTSASGQATVAVRQQRRQQRPAVIHSPGPANSPRVLAAPHLQRRLAVPVPRLQAGARRHQHLDHLHTALLRSNEKRGGVRLQDEGGQQRGLRRCRRRKGPTRSMEKGTTT